MDLENIREELRRLSALAGGWNSAEGITALERDLALEKLRLLYDAIRFAEPLPAEEPEAESVPKTVPVGLGLDDLLSPVAGFAQTAVAAEPAAEEPIAESVPEPEPAAEEPVAESAPTAEPVSAPEPAVRSEEIPACEPVAPVIPTEPAVPENAASVSVTEQEPAPAPQPVVGSLFGLEEDETLRHRRKQRVIMSLYDVAPSSPKSVREERTERPGTPSREEVSAPEIPAAPASALEKTTGTGDKSDAARPAEAVAAGEEFTEAAVVPDTALPQAAPLHSETDPVPEPVSPQSPSGTGTDDPVAAAGSDEPDLEEITLGAGSVLGEVINHDVQTLADTLEAPHDMASELKRREPVTDLERAIGINDKFLLIRDLFNGDAAAYDAAVRTLNAFGDLDDCMIYIAENFAWNPNSDGAKLMMELLERKFA